MDGFCPRCGLHTAGTGLAVEDPRFCFLCADGEADAGRAAELIEATAAGRRDAAGILELVTDPRALDHLLAGAQHPSPLVRAACLLALAGYQDPRSSPPAIRSLSDRDRRVREAAITCLAELSDTASADALATRLRHRTEGLECALALAWRRDERGFAPLLRAVMKGGDSLRNPHRSPAAALLWYGTERAVPHLVVALDAAARAWVGSGGTDLRARQPANLLASLLATVDDPGAAAPVERAVAAFGGLNLFWFQPPPPRPEPRAPSPDHTVPRWSLLLHRAPEPVTGPVTKFGGQPVWLTAPTWPLTAAGTPMTFFAQFRLPWRDEALAYLFLDLGGAGMGMSEGGGASLFVQPGVAPQVPHAARVTGPTYPHEGRLDLSRFHLVSKRERIESVPDLVPGLDPEDWDDGEHDSSDNRVWNKLGGMPRWLQGPEHPGPDHRFLFQFSASHIGYELADGAECYGFVTADGRGVFLWQCH